MIFIHIQKGRFSGPHQCSGSYNNCEIRYSLCIASGWTFKWLGWTREMAVPVSSRRRKNSQCCQLPRIILETPDFGPYLPVSRYKEYEIGRIIAEVCNFFISVTQLSDNIKISTILRCLNDFNVNIEGFLINSSMQLWLDNNVIGGK